MGLHDEAIVIDGLIVSRWSEAVFRDMRAGGITAANCTCCVWEGFHDTMRNIARWKQWLRTHADMLLVTGPVSVNMEEALRRTYDAMPAPKLVIAIGDCGACGGIFGASYASRGSVANILPVNTTVTDCPPTPTAILRGILETVRPTLAKG